MSEFLAEAQVLIRPNTTAFAASLVKEINASILAAEKGIKPITVPVAAGTTVAAKAASQSAGQVAKSQLAGAAAAKKSASAQITLSEAYQLNAASLARLAGVEEAASLTTTNLAAKRAVLREVNAAAALSQEALAASVKSGNTALVLAQANVTRLVLATREMAVADVQATIAENELAASVAARGRAEAFAARGAAATGLSLAGLRGATLAANAAFIAGAAGLIAFAKSVSLAANFEKQLNVLQATAGATADEMARISEAARALGSDISLPGVSATDAAVAMTELAKAGLSVQDSIGGARGVLLLATAAELDNASATEIVANALNSFGLAGTKAVQVADLLSAASVEAQGSIGDMGAALTSVASVSRQVGISLEDTVALLTILAKNGIQGANGGTVLRVALLRLVAPSAAAAAELDKLGVAIRDSQGRIRPEVFADLEEATRKLTARQRDFALATIFGARGIRAQVNIAREGVAGLNAVRDATTQGGDAARLAKAQTQGLSGSFENLKNQTEEAGITIGNLASGPLKAVVGGLTLWVVAFNKASVATKNFINSDAVKPIVDYQKAIFGAGQNVGEFLDEVTKGIPVLDGFFNTIGGGADTTEKTATAFDHLGVSVTRTIDDLSKALGKLGAASAAKAGAKASAQGTFGKIAGLEEQILDTRGSRNAELALRKQEVSILNEKIASGNLSIENRRKLKSERDRVLSEIEAIENQMASDAEQAASEVQSARDKADSAFLDMIGRAQGRAETLIERAGGTKELKDDILLNVAFRNLLRKQIDLVKATVKDAARKASELADITRQLAVVTNEIKGLRRRQRELLQQQREDRLAQQDKSIQLDIELADINENTKRRISLRQQLIVQLKKEARILKLHGNALKENRNERARIRAEIAEIRKEEKGAAGAAGDFNKLSFEFLQRQQGFAANLLSNLIPSGATGGLVGGTSPASQSAINVPGLGVTQESQIAQGKDVGFSAGQGNTTNSILRKILHNLELLNGHSSHPEARNQRIQHSGSANYTAM